MSVVNSAIPSVLFGHNASVKAWCLTGRNYSPTATQPAFDAVNFIDGYNLRLDVDTQLTGGIGSAATSVDVLSGALKFSFLNPMPDNKYKVFLQWYVDSTTSQETPFAHVLNSSKFPKTVESFWVRTGLPSFVASGSSEANRIIGIRFGIRIANLGVVVL